jgi:dTDP-4-dehydrorhamnose reductase
VKVAVIGANGQLGADVCARFAANGDEVLPLTHTELEITSEDATRQALGAAKPSVIVNTAAMHHVENCEKDPAQAFAVNAIGARNVATAARELDAALVHISTDYVFDGAKQAPYVESDAPFPLNVYGNSKLSGEYFVRATAPRHFVLRVSAIYGKGRCRAKGHNFVQLMLKLAKERDELRVVTDEIVSPTPTQQIAEQIVRLSRSDAYGLYHGTSEGSCSWFEFAREIFSLAGVKTRVTPAAPGEFPAKVPRPAYSVLENATLKQNGLNVFTDWHEGLRAFMQTT